MEQVHAGRPGTAANDTTCWNCVHNPVCAAAVDTHPLAGIAQDKGYAMGPSFSRINDGSYRHGEGGRFSGPVKLKCSERARHWQRSATQTVEAILSHGEASTPALVQMIEAARRICLTAAEGQVDQGGMELTQGQAPPPTSAMAQPLKLDRPQRRRRKRNGLCGCIGRH
eukprot:COSAG01_NODE_3885_length_5566_cov_10.185529_2_plen_169_part_00